MINDFINKVSDRNREKKYKLFCELLSPDATSTILDVGAAEREYRDTSNILEKKYPYPEKITVLGVDKYDTFCVRYPQVKVLRYAGGKFPFKDNSFDLCWCNAVIEHVGGRKQQELFIKEIARVAKRAFITTPNRYFILESHTKVLALHYLPRDIFNKILKITHNSYPGHLINLLSYNELEELLHSNNIRNYEIIKNKIFGFAIDYVVVL